MNGCALTGSQPRIEYADMVVLQKNLMMLRGRKQRIQRVGVSRKISGHSVPQTVTARVVQQCELVLEVRLPPIAGVSR